jgi:hypothetical protein
LFLESEARSATRGENHAFGPDEIKVFNALRNVWLAADPATEVIAKKSLLNEVSAIP